MDKQALIKDVMGDNIDHLIAQLEDAEASYIEHRRTLYARDKAENRRLLRAVMPSSAHDQPDIQLARGMAAELTRPTFVYLNQRQWEDAPPRLHRHVEIMGLQVRTSLEIPEDTAFMTIKEFNPDDLGRAMQRGQKLPLLQ
jgi:hypothetical protein